MSVFKRLLTARPKLSVVPGDASHRLSGIWLIILACFAGFLFSVLAFFPGWMSPDSLAQYDQGKHGIYYDWHPVLMAWWWGKLDQIYEGPALMLMQHLVLYWGGWGLMALSSRRWTGWYAYLVPALGFWPGLLYPLGQIWKDIGFATAMFFAWGILLNAYSQSRKTQSWEGAVVLVLGLYAFGVKTNGLVALPFLFGFWILAEGWQKNSWIGKAIFSLSLTALVALAAMLIVPSERVIKTHSFQYIQTHDLLAISAKTDQTLLPPYITKRVGENPEQLKKLYFPGSNDFLYYMTVGDLTTVDATELADLSQRWRDAITKNPVIYFEHRIAVFKQLLRWGEKLSAMVAAPRIVENSYGLSFQKNSFSDWLAAQPVQHPWMFFPWIYLVVLLSSMVLLFVLRWHRALAFTMGGSAIAFVLPHLFIGPAADFRYLYYAYFCALILAYFAVYALLREIANRKASTGWKMTVLYQAIERRMQYAGRILAKIIQYRRDHGTHALVGAIKRRLNNHTNTSTFQQHSSIEIPVTKIKPRQLNEAYDLIMAIGCWEGESKRYRIYNIAEGLTAMGYSVLTIPYSEAEKIVQYELKASAIVLFRAPYDLIIGIDEVLSYAKARGIKVVFDVDDLVFEPDIVDQVDGFRLLNNSEKAQYLDGVQKYRQLLLRADLVTVPTEYLRRQVETLSKPCAVVPNSINYTQLSVAKDLVQKSREVQPFIRIGYFSGSHTHNKDFEQCEQALLDIMSAYPNTILRIVGHLDLKMCWDQFSDRIERIEFQPYQVMMHLLGGIDINIAPLEIDNPFCQSKSELKFFEAALLGIPTIASATDVYIAAIEQGVSGFYARNHDDWFSALEKLVNSAVLRREMGARAKISALERFGIDTVARIAAMTFGLKPTQATTVPRSTATESMPLSKKLRIAWIIPGLIIGGGGHRNILRAAYFLQQFGHQITLYFIGTEQDPIELKRLINEHFYPIDCPIFLYNGAIQSTDVIFATHWSTVSAALQNQNLVQEVMYFVQDFEPAFAPMGTEYVLAENTYRQGLYHITSGPWCEVTLRRDFQADADHFQFPVDRSIYYPRPRHYERKNLIYFAKPEMPRRCFELGLIALRELHKLCPDVEIILFGSPQAGKQRYDFPVTLRDIVPTLDDLAVLYSNGDIGLVFSTTNPSLVPYEMMACGLPVVDLRRANNEINYDNRFDIALLANPLPEKMAIEIAALLADPYELRARRKAGLEFIDSFPSEEEMARRIESLILKRLHQKTQHNV